MRKTAKFTKPKMSKITHNFFFENVKNRATFVEGFWLEVYARGRFMKYSMSVCPPLLIRRDFSAHLMQLFFHGLYNLETLQNSYRLGANVLIVKLFK